MAHPSFKILKIKPMLLIIVFVFKFSLIFLHLTWGYLLPFSAFVILFYLVFENYSNMLF